MIDTEKNEIEIIEIDSKGVESIEIVEEDTLIDCGIEVIDSEDFLNGNVLDKTYGGLIEGISDVLNQRMSKDNRDFLMINLRELQKKTPLSVELIRYALLSGLEGHRKAINSLYTGYGKRLVKKEMTRFRKFLKINKIKTSRGTSYYHRKVNYGDIRKVLIGRKLTVFSI